MNQEFMKQKKVLPLVLSMSLPMMVSMLINSLYNIVDSMFVAQIGEAALTAVSLVYPLQMLVTSIGVGFGVGISAAAAFYLGAGEQREAGKAASQGFFLSIVHGVCLSVGLTASLPVFLKLFTKDGQIYSWGLEYGVIVMAFSVVVTTQIAFEKIYQSLGNMIVPTVCLAAGCITNIVLDPVFIFGLGPVPRMEVRGAAVATVIGQLVTLLLYVAYFSKKGMGIEFSRRLMKPTGDVCRRLYMVGVPSSLTMGLPSLLVTLLNGLAGAFSAMYVLILGVYFKLQTFIYLPASGIVQGMRPVLSYNYGAGEHGRVKKIYNLAMGMNAAIMAAGTIICLVGSPALIGMFTTNADTIAAGQVALRIISAGFLVSTLSVTASGSLEALGKGTQSLIISLCRYIIIMIPAAWILCRLFGPVGVWHAFWVTELLSALAAALVYKRTVKLNV